MAVIVRVVQYILLEFVRAGQHFLPSPNQDLTLDEIALVHTQLRFGNDFSGDFLEYLRWVDPLVVEQLLHGHSYWWTLANSQTPFYVRLQLTTPTTMPNLFGIAYRLMK